MRLRDGLTSRPATPRDADSILELVATCETEADGVAETDRHDIAVMFGHHGFDPELDTVLVFDGDEPAGWATLYRGRSEGDVRPSHPGRGIGSALLSWTEGRARELGEPAVGQTKTDANEHARSLFLANGYQPTWTSWIIRTELDEPPARRPVVPEASRSAPTTPRTRGPCTS